MRFDRKVLGRCRTVEGVFKLRAGRGRYCEAWMVCLVEGFSAACWKVSKVALVVPGAEGRAPGLDRSVEALAMSVPRVFRLLPGVPGTEERRSP